MVLKNIQFINLESDQKMKLQTDLKQRIELVINSPKLFPQKELVKYGITQSTVSAYRNGKNINNATLSTILKLLDAYDDKIK